MVPDPVVRPVAYRVSCLPPESVNYVAFSITVERRGPGDDRFAVLHHGRCLSKDGKWDFEPMPSSRTDEWIIGHRFSLETALRLAKKQAPLIRINGHTVCDVLAHEEGRR